MVSAQSIFENLRDHLRRISSLEQPFGLIILNFSRLIPYYRQAKFIQAARAYIEDSFTVQGKVSFLLPNLDVVIVYEKSETVHQEKLFYHLRELFTHDPLMSMETFGEIDNLFLQVFTVREQHDFVYSELARLQATVEEFIQKHDKKLQARAKASHNQDNMLNFVTASDQEQFSTTSHDPAAEVARVGKLAARYRNLDITQVLRREHVIQYLPHSEQEYEFAFSLLDPELLKLMTYKDQRVDADDALMNRYLGHILDYRLLDYLLKSEDKKLRQDIAFVVHPELVLDKQFARFDERFSKGGQNRVILQFRLSDIYADYRLFCFARHFLRERGYRLAIAEIRYEAIETIDLGRLGMNYLFLRAEADWAFHMNAPDSLVCREITKIGSERIIMTNCAQSRTVEFAAKAGIRFMSGQNMRERFDLARAGTDFREQNTAQGLLLADSMRKRSRS